MQISPPIQRSSNQPSLHHGASDGSRAPLPLVVPTKMLRFLEHEDLGAVDPSHGAPGFRATRVK